PSAPSHPRITASSTAPRLTARGPPPEDQAKRCGLSYINDQMSGADKPTLPSLDALPAEDAPKTTGVGEPKGVDAVRDAWKRLPARPGVYRMIGADGEVLYVGKAKSLKNRVGQYAQGRGHGNHILRMIHQTRALEVIVTATETEALLLETNMIK